MVDQAARGPEPSPAAVHAWRRLTETDGNVPIAALAEQVGWSQRHLIARFKQQIGLTPKSAARILRFASVLRSVATLPVVHWATVAAEHGYCDQAHQCADFRAFTGTTPTAWAFEHDRLVVDLGLC
jgi:transcriptional regulator GlxA family with amidase domain